MTHKYSCVCKFLRYYGDHSLRHVFPVGGNAGFVYHFSKGNIISRQEPISNIVESVMCMQITDMKVIPMDQLTPESAVFWKAVVVYVNQCAQEGTVDEEYVQKILPELTHFTKFVKE